MKNNIKPFLLLKHKTEQSIVLIKDDHPELIEWIAKGFRKYDSGTRNDCLRLLEDYWDENNIVDEEKLFVEVK